jgi:hypothetical protein
MRQEKGGRLIPKVMIVWTFAKISIIRMYIGPTNVKFKTLLDFFKKLSLFRILGS